MVRGIVTGYRLCRRAPNLDESTIGRTLCSMLTGCLAAGRLAAVARRFSGQGPGAQGPRGQGPRGPGARAQGPGARGHGARGQSPGARGQGPFSGGAAVAQGVSQPVAPCGGRLGCPKKPFKLAGWLAGRNLSSWLVGWVAGWLARGAGSLAACGGLWRPFGMP